MRIEKPLRLSGLVTLLAGVLLVVAELLTLFLSVLPLSLPLFAFNIQGFLGINGYLGILLAVLMQLGLVGLYTSQAKTLGVLGLVGFLIAFIGTRFVMNPSFVNPIIKPFLSPLGEASGALWGQLGVLVLCFVVGWVLFGIATLRAGVYPRAASSLLIAGTLILVLSLPLSSVVFAAALAWMGYFLFRKSSQEAVRSASV
jgi:hypothetical protein